MDASMNQSIAWLLVWGWGWLGSVFFLSFLCVARAYSAVTFCCGGGVCVGVV